MEDRLKLLEAIRCKEPVGGLTHEFYRYPARFSPKFARATIERFTSPGDVVFDPFMGSGTVLVEARAMARHGVGTDISSWICSPRKISGHKKSHTVLRISDTCETCCESLEIGVLSSSQVAPTERTISKQLTQNAAA